MAVQNEVRDKRKQIHGYVNANARLIAELDARDAQIGALQGFNQPATPAKTLSKIQGPETLSLRVYVTI